MILTGSRSVRRRLLEPVLEIAEQSPLVVIDEHRRGGVHRVDEGQILPDAAFAQALLDPGLDVVIDS